METKLHNNSTLIVIEGLDGSGKSTQVPLIVPALERVGITARQISFPDYSSKSSSLVKMYLGGELGGQASDINAYAASAFYAVDRFASFSTKWKDSYCSGIPIIAERYTSSNLIYQLSKLEKSQWDDYIEWSLDFEFSKMGLPRPDLTIYLSMPLDISQQLMSVRYDESGGKKDIHEKDIEFLIACRECAEYSAAKLGWKIIDCAKDGKPLPVGLIHGKIMDMILKKLKGGETQ